MSICRLVLTFLFLCAALGAKGQESAAGERVASAGQAVASSAVRLGSESGDSARKRTAEEAIRRAFEERFGLHEPIYFIYGNEPQGAKYQFSFKYRVLGDREPVGEDGAETLRRVFFGYTQRSLWDIDSLSSPFYDSSYMPELFFESTRTLDAQAISAADRFAFLGYQVGIKHESNGRAGADSRSLNTLQFRTAFVLGDLARWHGIVAPRLWAYVSDSSDNPDIRDYRGNVELQVAIQHGDGVALSATGRVGRKGRRGSVQLDLTVPIELKGRFNFASYLMVQYWSGYGESLLDYNKHSDALRFGFSLLR
ncbi:hypothetical protein AXK12_03570 [Cephaloticoccus capnophilus]|uniref:Phosphatidylcholine 1-acylhydrolase n=1 Tax=Cephaloticoccus capnophilus TaxID=1548208 RepID=A0A139SNS5_9BACT|nr:phospholipase A [Cephaloticoccus capnophilus]KXU36229.1 hypothetical protein AXK12_03570 [Cephaloticoccus capnophilus]